MWSESKFINLMYNFEFLVNCLSLFHQRSLTEGGRISTVDLLVLTSLDQLLFILKIFFFTFFTKQATSMRKPTVLILPPQLVFPGLTLSSLSNICWQ